MIGAHEPAHRDAREDSETAKRQFHSQSCPLPVLMLRHDAGKVNQSLSPVRDAMGHRQRLIHLVRERPNRLAGDPLSAPAHLAPRCNALYND